MNVNIVAVRIDFFDSFILCFSNNNAVNKKVNEYTINPMLIFKFWPIFIVIPLNKQDIIKSIYKIIE